MRHLRRALTALLCASVLPLAAAEKPNILLIMADDMGYSDIGCYGGEIRTPNLDALAEGGIRFSQFYNAARCCPTRASLLTGLYPHQAGVGGMVGGKKPGPYQGYLNDRCVTIAEVLRPAGYATYMSGKWHVGENRPNWPVDRGFDRYYGLISGGMNYFNIEKGKRKNITRHFARDQEPLRPGGDGFYLTDAITDHAVQCIREHPASRPFFQYVAYTAPHWPLHARPEDIARYRGSYMKGWAALRKERLPRLRALGLIDDAWPLSGVDPGAADWDAVKDKETMDLKMAVYAAQIDRMDRGIGRVVAALKAKGLFENTLVMFLSDNGASSEKGPLGHNFRPDLKGEIGTEDSYQSYGLSWANASNTPFRKFKKYTHEGGIATPFIVSWPAGVKGAGRVVHDLAHVIDVMSSCVEAAGAAYPREHRGKAIHPMEGRSFLPSLGGKTGAVPRDLYWEHYGNCAVRSGRWKLVKGGKGPWELYDLTADRTELNNLAAKHPERVKELGGKYEAWAERVGVNP
jgi:arylsulfatase